MHWKIQRSEHHRFASDSNEEAMMFQAKWKDSPHQVLFWIVAITVAFVSMLVVAKSLAG
ncbi:MAG: hypothetical protein AAGA03_19785 [Planctomycetota bacterium]